MQIPAPIIAAIATRTIRAIAQGGKPARRMEKNRLEELEKRDDVGLSIVLLF